MEGAAQLVPRKGRHCLLIALSYMRACACIHFMLYMLQCFVSCIVLFTVSCRQTETLSHIISVTLVFTSSFVQFEAELVGLEALEEKRKL